MRKPIVMRQRPVQVIGDQSPPAIFYPRPAIPAQLFLEPRFEAPPSPEPRAEDGDEAPDDATRPDSDW